MDKLYKIAEVRRMVRKSTTRIYVDMEAGRFPRPVRIGARAVAWRESDLEAWMAERVAERDAVEAA